MKLYVLTRRDLPWAVRCVQSIHATLMLYKQNLMSSDLPVVLVGLTNEQELTKWLDKLWIDKINAVGFREPDLGNELTAIAFISSPLEELSALRLL